MIFLSNKFPDDVDDAGLGPHLKTTVFIQHSFYNLISHKRSLEIKLLTTIPPPVKFGVFKDIHTRFWMLRVKYQFNSVTCFCNCKLELTSVPTS